MMGKQILAPTVEFMLSMNTWVRMAPPESFGRGRIYFVLVKWGFEGDSLQFQIQLL